MTANDPADHPAIVGVLDRRTADWQREFPGVAVEDRGSDIRLAIPAALRVGHEAHFATVLGNSSGTSTSPGRSRGGSGRTC